MNMELASQKIPVTASYKSKIQTYCIQASS